MRLLPSKSLPTFSFATGILSAGALCMVYIAGQDEKGLYPAMHPGWILGCLICALALVFLALVCKDLNGRFRYHHLFRPSVPAAAGTLAAAVVLGLEGIGFIVQQMDLYDLITGVLCLAGAFCLLFLARCSQTGKRPAYQIRSVVTVALMLRLICCFRHWTAPQVITYLFPLLASVFLMLACYHRTAMDAGAHNRRAYVFTSQAAVVLCCGAVISSEWLFYLVTALWMGLDIPDLRHSKAHKQKD